MYGSKYVWGSDSKCGFHRILFIYHVFEVKFRTEGYLFCVLLFVFFAAGFGVFLGFLVPGFPASLLSPLLCFCASVPFNFTIVHVLFSSHVFLLLYFLLLCFSASCLYCLFVFSFLLLYSLLFVS